jgi:hypothetical protein
MHESPALQKKKKKQQKPLFVKLMWEAGEDHECSLGYGETYFVQKNEVGVGQVWWQMTIIQTMQEAEVEESQSEANPGKCTRPYLKN